MPAREFSQAQVPGDVLRMDAEVFGEQCYGIIRAEFDRLPG